MIEVEIWSDFACPFCYIGMRNFEKALSQLGNQDDVHVTYRSFELDPAAKKSQAGGIDALLANKYGKTIEWAQTMNANVTKTAAASGIEFHMDKIIPTNSFDAHRLSHLAEKYAMQAQLQERLFAAYFTEGKDIADHDVLHEIGNELAINEEEVAQALASADYAAAVRKDEETANELGISGVPFFVFNRRLAVSGAQPPEAFIQAFNELEKGEA